MRETDWSLAFFLLAFASHFIWAHRMWRLQDQLDALQKAWRSDKRELEKYQDAYGSLPDEDDDDY